MRSFLWSLPNHQLSGILSRRFATLLPLGVLFCLAFCLIFIHLSIYLRSSLSPLGFKKTEKQCLQQNRSGSEDKFWAPDRPAQSGHLFFFLLLGLKKPDRYQIAFEGALCLYRFNIVAIERRLGFGTIWEREFIRRKYNLARVI